MPVILFIWHVEGDMGDAIAVGPFSSWGRAEAYREELTAADILADEALNAVVVSLLNQGEGLTLMPPPPL